MAIAPLPQQLDQETEVPEGLWPRPVLTVVRAEHARMPGARATEDPCQFHPSTGVPTRRTVDVAERRRARASARVRRRRLALAVVTGALLAGLALPAGALGGHSPVGAAPTLPGAVEGGRGTLYTVRPGDTLWSIASRLEPGGDPRPLVARLQAEIGATSLVPGERLRVP